MTPRKPRLSHLLLICCIALSAGWGRVSLGSQEQGGVMPSVIAAKDVTGLWRAIDDKSKKPTSLIRLQFNGETLQGRVEKILNVTNGPKPTCVKCRGERANQPVEGMVILWGLTRDGDSYSGGEVLDPGSGSTYRCKLRLLSRDTIEIRGYLGFSAFGRSQVWHREPEAPLGGEK